MLRSWTNRMPDARVQIHTWQNYHAMYPTFKNCTPLGNQLTLFMANNAMPFLSAPCVDLDESSQQM